MGLAGARTGAVTFIQRFGGSVNLNVHFHLLALDGVYRLDSTAKTLLHFRPVQPPTPQQLQILIERIAERIGRRLERLGYLTRESAEGQDPRLSFPDDAELSAYLAEIVPVAHPLGITLTAMTLAAGAALLAVRTPIWSQGVMWNSIMHDDLPALGTRFRVPIIFIQGAEDRLTVTRLRHVYFDEIRAPQKQFVVLPRVGHLAIFTARDAFLGVLIAHVLPMARANE